MVAVVTVIVIVIGAALFLFRPFLAINDQFRVACPQLGSREV